MDFHFQDFRFLGEELSVLQRQIAENKLAHAVLISGEPGYGKRTLAKLLAQAVLCHSDGDKPCGTCNSCRMVSAGEHPDLIILEKGSPLTPNAPKRNVIPVGDVREMIRICSAYPFEGNNRVVLISQAEYMNEQAQNALLKILEEPPAHTFFFLTSAHTDQILTTVLSRCRQVKMKPWDDAGISSVLVDSGVEPFMAEQISMAAHGSIGVALRLSADADYWKDREEIVHDFFHLSDRSSILSISTRWKDRKDECDQIFSTLEDYVRLLLSFRFGLADKKRLTLLSQRWILFASEAPLSGFSELFDKISLARRQCASNVSFQAVMEQLLLEFIGIVQENVV